MSRIKYEEVSIAKQDTQVSFIAEVDVVVYLRPNYKLLVYFFMNVPASV